MNIKEVTTKQQFEDMMELVALHPNKEYDCSFDRNKEILQNAVFGSPDFRAWVAYLGNKPVAYISACRSCEPCNQIVIDDIMGLSGYSGRGIILSLIERVSGWANESKALRVIFSTPREFDVWIRFLNSFTKKWGGKYKKQTLIIWEV